MKNVLILMLALPLLVLTVSCEKGVAADGDNLHGDVAGERLRGEIVLGDRLENPYTTVNMRKAYSSLYPTKSSRDAVETTHLYVRFLPADADELGSLHDMGLVLYDYPLDYEILVDGDYYHDPAIAEGDITWQYSVVEKDFVFPRIRYEVLDECCISESDYITRASDVDFDALEREAFRITGNEGLLEDATKAAKHIPEGRLTVSDPDFNNGQKAGVAGIRVVANVFVKIAKGYTDADGYFKLNKGFSASKIRYRAVFENERGFDIGFNFVLVPASVASLGKHSSEWMEVHFDRNEDPLAWRRAIVNNAMYEYWSDCVKDAAVSAPPEDLRIWIMDSMTDDYTLMLHQGAVWDGSFLDDKFPAIVRILKLFMPDILIGAGDFKYASDLYRDVYHEAAHASHFSQAGKAYWNNYAASMAANAITGNDRFGTGESELDGYSGIAEMWAYYYGSRYYNRRYDADGVFGSDCWFKPQALEALEQEGISPSSIFSMFTSELHSIKSLSEEIRNKYGNDCADCFDVYFGFKSFKDGFKIRGDDDKSGEKLPVGKYPPRPHLSVK